MDTRLIELLACPVSHQPLQLANPATLKRINAAVADGGALFGEVRQTDLLREALITQDGAYAYRVDDGIPVLLPEERLDLRTLPA